MSDAFEKRIKKHIIGKPHRFLAVVPLGFEQTLINELTFIGVDTSDALSRHLEQRENTKTKDANQPHVTGDGKVEFTAKITEAWKAVAFSRIANRVLMHIADFKAENFRELEKKASEIPWELFLDERTGYALQTRDERYFGKVITQAHNSIGSVMPACKQPVAKLASHVILEPKAIESTPHQQQSLSIHVTCKHSRLYHSDAITERLQKIICKTSSSLDSSPHSGIMPTKATSCQVVKETPAFQASAQDDKIAKHQSKVLSPLKASGTSDLIAHTSKRSDLIPHTSYPQHIYVTLIDDRCTIWLDLAGEELYKRGHERYVNDAPLKETIAAAMLFEAIHLTDPTLSLRAKTSTNPQDDRIGKPQSERSERPHSTLTTNHQPLATIIDPMAGSGTFSLEAAYIANKFIPGKCRNFALKHQPAFKEATWNYIIKRENSNSVILSEAPQGAKSKNLNIVTSDISERAIEIIKHNVENSPLAGISPNGDMPTINPQLKDFFAYTAKEIADFSKESSPVIVLNPPYGKRLDFDAPKLYTKIGRKLTELAHDLKQFNKTLTVAILAPKDDSREGSKYTCTSNLLRECAALSPEHNSAAKLIATSHGGFSLNVFIAQLNH